ncbi:MAG: hypothetical protein O2854_01985 [Chloroflexi bacterium]|nr:hypothetical protein [Chloroflexota bacterium]
MEQASNRIHGKWWLNKKSLIVLVAIVAIVIVIIAPWKSGSSSDPISQIEARSILQQMTTYANQNDLVSLCGQSSSQIGCESAWRVAGEWTAVPSLAPVIKESFVPPLTSIQGSNATKNARVLVLTGVDGLGKDYETEFLVFRNNNGDTVIENAIYWAGATN